MKKPAYFLMFMTCSVIALTSCGMYVGNPPKTEVNETTTHETTTQPPDEVHVYTP